MYELCFLSDMKTEQLAQWVQGVGTLLAAALAVFAVWYADNLQRKREREITYKRKLDQFDALIHVANKVTEKIDALCNRFDAELGSEPGYVLKTATEYREDLADVAAMLNEFSLSDLPAYLLIADVARLRTILNDIPIVAGELSGLLLLQTANIVNHYEKLTYFQKAAKETTVGIAQSRLALKEEYLQKPWRNKQRKNGK